MDPTAPELFIPLAFFSLMGGVYTGIIIGRVILLICLHTHPHH